MGLWLLTSFALAGNVEIAVSNGGEVKVQAAEEPVYVASCRGILWEIFNVETSVFEPTVAPPCEGMKSAIRIDQEGQTFQLDAVLPPLPDVGFHVVRPVVVYGLKCREKAPFSLSGCAEIKAETGPQVAVRTRGSVIEVAPSDGR